MEVDGGKGAGREGGWVLSSQSGGRELSFNVFKFKQWLCLCLDIANCSGPSHNLK